jgi:catechol 2,3-dioxygenase-like lactoylglutathione lyase family enzyme
MLNSVSPFFIVDDLNATLEFYLSRLGFSVLYKGGGERPEEDFWARPGDAELQGDRARGASATESHAP